MSQKTSPATGEIYRLNRVCESWGMPGSTLYAKRRKVSLEGSGDKSDKRGPKVIVSDSDIVENIKADIKAYPFKRERFNTYGRTSPSFSIETGPGRTQSPRRHDHYA
jgi:hypothetical protein